MTPAPESDLTSFARVRNAALANFARDGVAATSIRRVAKSAGVSPGRVQYHFATKAELVAAVNDYVVSVATEAFADVPSADSPDAASRELGLRVSALIRDHHDALLYVARASTEAGGEEPNLFDTFVEIAAKQWTQVAEAGHLRDDTDRQWTALNTVLFNLAPLLFEAALDRHLPQPFSSPGGLERWQTAGTQLFSHGVYRTKSRSGGS